MAQKHNEYKEQPMTRAGKIQGPSRRYWRLRHPNFPAAEWADKNPLLQRGELGIEKDTHKMKAGDGVTYWNDLPYMYDDAGQPLSTADYQMGNASGGWTTMSEAQQDALNSGATTTNIGQIATNTNDIATNKGTMDNHIANTSNPHSVTKAQVGLGNVDNTSDLDKPISTATQTALDNKVDKNAAITGATKCKITYDNKGLVTGGADLAESDIPALHLSKISDVTASAAEINILDGLTATTTELNYVDGVTGPIQTQISNNKTAIDNHIANTSNPHSVTAAQVGLGNCDNTSDLNKPISTATQTALDGKQAKSASAYNMGNATGGWDAMSTAQQNALNSGATTTNIGQIATNTTNIANEIIDRQNADNGLQGQIDAIVSKSDVVDIVGTYADLQAYDTSGLGNNDVVKVLDDSTHNDAQSYYRWVITGGVGAWVYIGSEAETYTKAETNALLNDKQDVITDLSTIRSGAAAGATALQPGDNVSELVNDAGYLTTHQSLTDLGITATASEINVLDGITASTNELNYVDGVTSSIQTQLDNKQGLLGGDTSGTVLTNSGTPGTVNATSLATVATSGAYSDLSGTPSLATVATSGQYSDLTGTPGVMTGASAGDAGTSGLVPAPAAGDQGKFLQGDGTWANPTAATAWGNITGTLSNQTDLQNALNAKANTATTLAGYGITDGANTDLSNLTSTGANIGNWSHNVSNCITEIPQDIKLELNAGTLTLKAGSVLTDPQGGTQRTTTQDQTGTLTANGQYMVFADRTTGALQLGSGYTVAKIGSGSTLPADGSTFNAFYNSTDGKMYRWNGSSWIVWGVAFPLGIITVFSGAISSIDQVFNGFGYIGSTVFALPGVKGLAPKGRNADGTLNSNVVNDSTVRTYTLSGTYNFMLAKTANAIGAYFYAYDPVNNYIYRTDTNARYNGDRYIFGSCSVESGIIKSFSTKQPFHAVDYSDYIKASGTVVAEQLPTSGNNYTWYRKYANGWVEQGQKITDGTTSITLPVPMANNFYTITVAQNGAASASIERAAISNQTSTGFNINNNKSALRPIYWQVSGMAA